MLGSGGVLCCFGPAADDMARWIPSTPEAVEGLIRGFGEGGAEEVMCWPTIAELDRWIASRSLSANPGQPRGLEGRGRLSRSVAWPPRRRGRERGRAD